MTHDTSTLGETDCVNAMPAEAATDLGLDEAHDERLPEGAAVAALFAAAVCVIAALLCAHLLVWGLA